MPTVRSYADIGFEPLAPTPPVGPYADIGFEPFTGPPAPTTDPLAALRKAERIGAPPPQPPRTVSGTLKDIGGTLLGAAIRLPEAAVGLADIPTLGRVGKFLEETIGFQPAQARAILAQAESPAQAWAGRQVTEQETALGKLGAALKNPSVIAKTTVESIPISLAGGVVGRAMPLVSPIARAALGEGVIQAGAVTEQAREQAPTGMLTPRDVAFTSASGAAIGLIASVGANVARLWGVQDIDTLLAGAARNPTVRHGVARDVLLGMVQEGGVEELPQGIVEQVLENQRTGRPIEEGVADNAVLSMLAGALMSVPANLAPGREAQPQPVTAPPPVQAPVAAPVPPPNVAAVPTQAPQGPPPVAEPVPGVPPTPRPPMPVEQQRAMFERWRALAAVAEQAEAERDAVEAAVTGRAVPEPTEAPPPVAEPRPPSMADTLSADEQRYAHLQALRRQLTDEEWAEFNALEAKLSGAPQTPAGAPPAAPEPLPTVTPEVPPAVNVEAAAPIAPPEVPSAVEEGIVPEGRVGEYPGVGPQRTPAEAGGRDSLGRGAAVGVPQAEPPRVGPQEAVAPPTSFTAILAKDAGDRSMREGGRTVWNEDDYAVAAAVSNRLATQPQPTRAPQEAGAPPPRTGPPPGTPKARKPKAKGRGIALTPELASAAGMDAGNRSMREGGRTVWNEDDYNAAAAVTNRLMDTVEPATAPPQAPPEPTAAPVAAVPRPEPPGIGTPPSPTAAALAKTSREAIDREQEDLTARRDALKAKREKARRGSKARDTLLSEIGALDQRIFALSEKGQEARDLDYQALLHETYADPATPWEAKWAIASKVWAGKRDNTIGNRAYEVLRDAARADLKAQGATDEDAERWGTDVASMLLSFPLSKTYWFDQAIPEALKRIEHQRGVKADREKLTALEQQYGMEGRNARMFILRDDMFPEERQRVLKEAETYFRETRAKLDKDAAEAAATQAAQTARLAKATAPGRFSARVPGPAAASEFRLTLTPDLASYEVVKRFVDIARAADFKLLPLQDQARIWDVLDAVNVKDLRYTQDKEGRTVKNPSAIGPNAEERLAERIKGVLERADERLTEAVKYAQRKGPPPATPVRGVRGGPTLASLGVVAPQAAATAATVPATRPTTLRPVAVPELVELATDLLNGPPLVVKKFKKAAKWGEFRPSTGQIRIHGEAFRAGQEDALAVTLGHEIGHAVDWLPDHYLKRGNLLGRLQTLRHYLTHTFSGPGGTIALKDVRAELEAVSQVLHPWNPATASASERAYRQSSVELYAEGLSMLLNDPGQLQSLAPIFTQAFLDGLPNKPNVETAYYELQALLHGTPEALTAHRRERVRGMQTRATEAWKAVEAANRENLRERTKAKTENVIQQLHERHTPYIRRVKAVEARGVPVPEEKNPVYALEERAYHAGVRRAYMKTQIDPIVKTMKDDGLTWEDDFGEVVFYERILGGDTSKMTAADWTAHLQDVLTQRAQGKPIPLGGDRAEIANPLGITPAVAQQLHRAMREDVGPAKWAVLQAQLAAFRMGTKAIADEAYQEGLYTTKQKATIDANPTYATWRVVDYLDQAQTARIRQQIGTLKDITNPATATVEKNLIVMAATEANRVKRIGIEFLKEYFPEEVAPAKTRWTGRWHEPLKPPRDQNLALVTVYEKGKQVGYYVPVSIADSLNNASYGNNWEPVKWLRFLNNVWFRPIFTTFNLGFQSFNLPRDFVRAWKNRPGMSLGRLAARYGKARHIARVRAFGPPKTPTPASGLAEQQFEEAEKARVFSLTFNDLAHERDVEDTQLETLMAQSGLAPAQPSPRFQAAHDILEFIRHVGDYVETLPKAAVMLDMIGPGGQVADLTPKQRSDLRGKIGSPDFLAGGTWKPISNNAFLFSSAITHAWAADLEMATNPKTRAEWWWKTAAFNLGPKVLMFLALKGLLTGGGHDDTGWLAELRRLMRKVSEYDLTNYLVVPLGEFNGKTLYLRVPQDDTGRVIAGLFWKALQMGAGDRELWRGLRDVMSYGTGQLPSVSPIAEAAVSFGQYFSGQNPYDMFRGKNVLTDEEQAARDWKTFAKFMRYEAETLGLSPLTSLLPSDRPSPPRDLLDWVVAMPVIGRWLKLSDAGEVQALRETQQQIAQEEARVRRKERAAINSTISKWGQEKEIPPGTYWAEARVIADRVYADKPREEIAQRTATLVKKLRLARIRVGADPVTDVLLSSGSNAQKIAVAKQAKAGMSAAEWAAWRAEATLLGVLTPAVDRAVSGPPPAR